MMLIKIILLLNVVFTTCNAFVSKTGIYRHALKPLFSSNNQIDDEIIIPIKIKPTKHDLYTGRDPQRVRIFDTTLRDGEQSPGCTMNTEEKIAVAKQLAKLGVDVIEAGFPVSSDGDFDAVSKIAQQIGNYPNPPFICYII